MTRADQNAEGAIAGAFREEWARIVATLIRRTGDWDLAEECAQEAFTEAARRWPAGGIPDRPGAWLATVAINRALDRLRRAQRGSELLEQVARDRSDPPAIARAGDEHNQSKLGAYSPSAESQAMKILIQDEHDAIDDDRLRLIFTCCHPALALESRVALTLRTLAGLTTAEIASAFLVPEATMGKRLTRAKAKIATAGIPYRVPPLALLPERLGGVLAVLYLLFNEGYLASHGDELIRRELCNEAIRLTRVLAELMPGEPEIAGLLALLLFGDSRRDARADRQGDLVTLEDQDRELWDRAQITEAVSLLDRLTRPPAGDRTFACGPYLLQAQIAACHATAKRPEQTNWALIASLYSQLEFVAGSPVVTLNRAVAVALAGDIDAGLELIDQLRAAGTLDRYHLLEAARADLLRRRGAPGDAAAARAAYIGALEHTAPGPEHRYLKRRLAELAELEDAG